MNHGTLNREREKLERKKEKKRIANNPRIWNLIALLLSHIPSLPWFSLGSRDTDYSNARKGWCYLGPPLWPVAKPRFPKHSRSRRIHQNKKKEKKRKVLEKLERSVGSSLSASLSPSLTRFVAVLKESLCTSGYFSLSLPLSCAFLCLPCSSWRFELEINRANPVFKACLSRAKREVGRKQGAS